MTTVSQREDASDSRFNDLKRNVGTASEPKSALHEYGVGIIYDRIKLSMDSIMGKERIKSRYGDVPAIELPTVSGEMSGNILEDVSEVTIPDVLTPIGGFIPDIALFNSDRKPVRVIEVVCTSAPADKKRDFFKAYNIEIVEVPCRNKDDLLSLARPTPRLDGPRIPHDDYPRRVAPWTPWPYARDIRDRRGRGPYERQQQADEAIGNLLENLMMASPHMRREFLRVVTTELGTLESLLPLYQDNPKRQALAPEEE